jgi:hypothetical protein
MAQGWAALQGGTIQAAFIEWSGQFSGGVILVIPSVIVIQACIVELSLSFSFYDGD